ncbi:MAG: diacylglycerol kinase family protein [Bacteroidota bacterium]|nr:diacylglycerol kinase family protein [Bacteroidota bacterium]MDP3144674.1 diacylglycerol kinase family protein [Bacteroidota bacterium]MDP3557010.1 diacylglycerol kinase family protein [Bacteroidota bacterium]
MSYLKDRINAFGYAFSGCVQALKTEKNLQLQLMISVLVIFAGVYFSIKVNEWLIVSACIAFVTSLELINSAIEKLCDLYSKEQNPTIKYIKDVSAAAVLVASIFTVLAGSFVFWPYVRHLLCD